MGKYPKNLAVLNAAAEKIGWGKPAPTGIYRGLAQMKAFDSYVAAAAEVSVAGNKITDLAPLAGLVVNRTHPVLAQLSGPQALAAADRLDKSGDAPLAAAVLRLHADRVATANRERRLVARFTKAHPTVSVVNVPAMPSDVHDLAGLREIGERLSGH